MTMITESGHIAAPLATSGTFTGFASRIRTYFRNRRAMADLTAMQEHMLRDIGLTRADVVQASIGESGAGTAMLNRARARRSA